MIQPKKTVSIWITVAEYHYIEQLRRREGYRSISSLIREKAVCPWLEEEKRKEKE